VLKADNNQDIYLVFEFMETDLHAVIRAGILEPVHCRYIMWQLFRALKYMHSGELLHRDIKPSNLLLNAECQVKVADFGLARSLAPEDRTPDGSGAGSSHANGGIVLTDYVATRWYRAPEILLGSTNYTFGVDMWSAGCILAELLAGRPMFPGKSTLDQIERILDVTGAPGPAELAACDSPYAAEMLNSLPELPPQQPRRPLRQMFPGAPPDAIDLLHQLLHFSPAQRITAAEALRHPYVSQFHSPATEPACDRVIAIPLDCNLKAGIEEYRDKLYAEIVKRKRELRRRMREKEAAKTVAVGAAQAAAQAAADHDPYAYPTRASNGAAAPAQIAAAPPPAPATASREYQQAGLQRRPSGGSSGAAGPYASQQQQPYANTYVHSTGTSPTKVWQQGRPADASNYGRAGQAQPPYRSGHAY
jgi:mitogen-activated protein kinase 15